MYSLPVNDQIIFYSFPFINNLFLLTWQTNSAEALNYNTRNNSSNAPAPAPDQSQAKDPRTEVTTRYVWYVYINMFCSFQLV